MTYRDLQPSFTSGELSPALGARVDLAKFQSGLQRAENLFIHPEGGVSNRAGTEFVREVKNSEHPVRLIRFEFNTEQTYVLEFGHLYFRVYREGGLILSNGSPYEVVTPYAYWHLEDLVVTQEADVLYLTHEAYPVHKLTRYAEDNWTVAVVSFAPSMAAPASISAAIVTGSGGVLYKYKVSAINAVSGEESLPSGEAHVANDLSIKGHKNRVTWSAVAGADRYIVYKDDNGVFGYIGGTSGTSFEDENIVADLADTPQTARNPFNGPGNYPRCSTFIEQRLAFASTANDPQAVYLSQSSNYENFGYSSPSKPNDAVTFRIKARQVNQIRSMLPMKGLMLLTSGAEWVVSGGSQSDAITPSSIKISNQGYRGAAKVQPIVVGDTVLFAQARGSVIRDFSYSLEKDGYDGKDLTVLARHLFKDRKIVSWDFAQAPYSLIWVVLDDGSMVTLTYLKEHDVWGWTRQTSAGGRFEQVVVVDEGEEDVPYFLIRREVNGRNVRYIERLHTRSVETIAEAFFVDSGLTYRGPKTRVVTGLDHLTGREVVALADGNVVRNLVVGPVVGGVGVELPNEAVVIHVGLPIVASLQTLGLDLGALQEKGTAQARKKSLARLHFHVENTRGIFVGNKDGDRGSRDLVEPKQRAGEGWGEPTRMTTGIVSITPTGNWTDEGSFWVKQFDPLPMTILSVMPDVVIGG